MSASLLDRNATGGVVARAGFEYQDAFVLQYLPQWLSQSAFSHIVSEAKSDIEVCYYCPTGSVRRHTYEAKDYALTENEFWSELADFKRMFDASPSEFVQFTLVCREFKAPVEPLINKLARLRGVGSSYTDTSPVVAATRTEIVAWVGTKGHSVELAEFIIERVDFLRYTSESAEIAFGGMLEKHLPTIELSPKRIGYLRDRCKSLIEQSSYGPVRRTDIERAIVEILDCDADAWLQTPTEIRLEPGYSGIEELVLDVGRFIGPDRRDATAVEWIGLLGTAKQVADFIVSSRTRRVIGLDGKQRMSLACAIGYVFSATSGFVLAIRHNGEVYRTDDHSQSDTSFFSYTQDDGDVASDVGLACIGCPTPVGNDFNVAGKSNVQLHALPRLILMSTMAISSISVANTAVSEAKFQLVGFRSGRKLKKLCLFLKVPSFFAMLLGHRLNGISEIQLFDWVEDHYVETVVLR